MSGPSYTTSLDSTRLRTPTGPAAGERTGRGAPGDAVVRAFAEIDREWGGFFAQPEYLHFAASDAP
jgi:hypothetical protein